MTRQPLLYDFLRPALFAGKNPLVVRLKLNNKLWIRLERVRSLVRRVLTGLTVRPSLPKTLDWRATATRQRHIRVTAVSPSPRGAQRSNRGLK